jgi:hypothetical protein
METIINLAFPLMTVVIGAACILLFGATATLRATNGDQEKRILFLEGKSARDDAKIEAQEQEIKLWAKTVTGEVHLVAITDLLTDHHTQAVTVWNQWNSHFDRLESLMTRLVELQEDVS